MSEQFILLAQLNVGKITTKMKENYRNKIKLVILPAELERIKLVSRLLKNGKVSRIQGV
jgi:hypothetical protein